MSEGSIQACIYSAVYMSTAIFLLLQETSQSPKQENYQLLFILGMVLFKTKDMILS